MEIIYSSYIISFVFLLTAINIYKAFAYQIGKKSNITFKQKLSIVIAAKNEEKNINSLFDSLELLNYPKDNYEVIFVDDNSTDKTAELIQSRVSGNKNYTFIKAANKEFEGKKGALSIGIKSAKYNFIVITDADCKPETNWLNAIAGVLDYGYDFVFGVAPIKTGSALVEKLSAFENLRNTYLTIAAVGLNIPYSAAARSFAFRKTSFERLGGYANTKETLSGDDDLLLREAVKNKMLIATVIEPGAFIFSDPSKSFTEYFKQKKRHLQTSFHYLLKQKLFLAFWHIINLISIASVLLSFFNPLFLFPVFVKLIYDFVIAIKFQQQLGHKFRFYEIIFLQLLYEVFVVINFFNSLKGKVEWK